MRILDAAGTATAAASATDVNVESPNVYHGVDGRLYLAFDLGQTYYTTLSVDSMYVGNGYVLKPGEIEVIVSDCYACT